MEFPPLAAPVRLAVLATFLQQKQATVKPELLFGHWPKPKVRNRPATAHWQNWWNLAIHLVVGQLRMKVLLPV